MGIIRDLERRINKFERKERTDEEKSRFASMLMRKFDYIAERRREGMDIKVFADQKHMRPAIRRAIKRYSDGRTTLNKAEEELNNLRETALKYLTERGYYSAAHEQSELRERGEAR
ncbi:hypothetical protein J4447_03505 [Candidatus Pacearchaeota archaeon]|nr:hypothetical protein [Candidatus Pacearchaeota archaeon]